MMSDEEYQEMLDNAPDFVDAEPPIQTVSEQVLPLLSKEDIDELLQWIDSR